MLKFNKQLKLNENGTRRYFYASLVSDLYYLKFQYFLVTSDIVKGVLFLHLFYDLIIEDIDVMPNFSVKIQN